MLAFEVEYLMGRVYAGQFRNRSEPEWPPHAGRLFSALAAAYFEGGRNEDEKNALEWLEAQGAPSLRASEAGKPEPGITAFVPTNYQGDFVPEMRGKQPRSFPVRTPADPVVLFVWSRAAPTGETRSALDRLASRVGYLGTSSSLVRLCLTEVDGDCNFEPDPAGSELLRTPAPGRLAELAHSFEAGLLPPIDGQQRYRRRAQSGGGVAISSFGEMLVFRRVSGAGLPSEATLTLTDAVRKAVMGNAGKDGSLPDAISGHGGGAHCSIVALPFAGEAHADGRIMGFGIVFPRDLSVVDRRRVIAASGALEQRGIHLGRSLGDWRIKLELSAAQVSLRTSTWTRRSQSWSSVTPILLDRFPKKNGPSIEDILGQACSRIGLPKPRRIEHGPYSLLPGVPPVARFRLQRKREERPRWGVHAQIEFPIEVEGPVILGAGRFFGLGLMRPWRDRTGELGDD